MEKKGIEGSKRHRAGDERSGLPWQSGLVGS